MNKAWLRKKRMTLWRWVPRLLGKRVRYWALIYEGVQHIRSDEEVSAVPYVEVLHRSGDALPGPLR